MEVMHSTAHNKLHTHTYMGMAGYFSCRDAQIRLLAARSAAVSGDSSDLAFTTQF